MGEPLKGISLNVLKRLMLLQSEVISLTSSLVPALAGACSIQVDLLTVRLPCSFFAFPVLCAIHCSLL